MSVKYILDIVSDRLGLVLPDQREILLRFLNEGARELYDQSDVPGSLMEQIFKVNGDQTITCPAYVGKIRGARELDSQAAISINKMRPRYNQFNWIDMWSNLRLRNTQALMATVSNQSVGILTVPAVESPAIIVSLSGPTATSAEATEDVVMDAITKQTVNAYLDYVSVKKDRINSHDVTLSDVDGKVLTIIPNNQLVAVYQVIDVSSCPWLATSSSVSDNYLEILYKKALTYLSNDNDEFPAQGCDNIIINKMTQLYYEGQGNVKLASMFDAKATRSLARMNEDQNRATEDMISFVAHPHDSLISRVRD